MSKAHLAPLSPLRCFPFQRCYQVPWPLRASSLEGLAQAHESHQQNEMGRALPDLGGQREQRSNASMEASTANTSASTGFPVPWQTPWAASV